MQNPQMMQQVMQQVAPMIQNAPGLLMRLAGAGPAMMPERPQTMMPIRGGTDMEIERTIPDAIAKANSYYSNDRPFRIPMQPMTPEMIRSMQDESVSPEDTETDWDLEDANKTDPNII